MKSDVSLKVNRQTWDAGIESGEPKWLDQGCFIIARGDGGDVTMMLMTEMVDVVPMVMLVATVVVFGVVVTVGVFIVSVTKAGGTEVMVEVLVVMMLAMTVVGMEVMMEDGDGIPKLYFPGTQLLVREPIF